MNTIKILTKRVPNDVNMLGELIDFSCRHNNILKKQKGFVKVKTFVHNYDTLYVLSEWENIYFWNQLKLPLNWTFLLPALMNWKKVFYRDRVCDAAGIYVS